ncbi:MAG: hypothetical protein CM15mP58_20250 [Burkholderiaceae bacterium]|nr:MAG: hypothetical protein CM15mP58_20250 [Burkholderiaceae bacterium]
MRRKNKLDLVIYVFENFLKTNFGGLTGSGRNNPAESLVEIHEKGGEEFLASNYRES